MLYLPIELTNVEGDLIGMTRTRDIYVKSNLNDISVYSLQDIRWQCEYHYLDVPVYTLRL